MSNEGFAVRIGPFKKRHLADVQNIMHQTFPNFKIDNLVNMYQFVYSRLLNRLERYTLEHSVSVFTSKFDSQVFVAEISGKAVGVAIIDYGGRHVWALSWLAVHPRWRGRGTGSKLLEATKCYVKTKKGKAVVLSVNARRKRAIKLYEQIGFRNTDILLQMTLKL